MRKYRNKSRGKRGVYSPRQIKTANQTPQTGTTSTGLGEAALVRKRLRSLRETFGMNHGSRCPLLARYLLGISELSRIFEVLHSEEEARRDGLSISFEVVERELTKCISGCLSDCSSQSRDTRRILCLLKAYKVVTPLLNGSPSVSLGRLYSMIEDNFQCSWLGRLLGIVIAGHHGVSQQAIVF